MTRVAYLSHVDSRWIKQRPHFLAEAIGASDGVSAAYFCSLFVSRARLVKGQALAIPVFRLPLVPQRYRNRFKLLDAMFSILAAFLIVLIWRPNALIATHARHRYVAATLRRFGVRVFYDCMDLNRLFPDVVPQDREGEKDLVRMSEAVFCSSAAIEREMLQLVPGSKVVTVPNAVDADSARIAGLEAVEFDAGTVRYIGTISSWFDMDAVMLLVSSSDVTVELFGPSDIQIPEHERIVHRGIVSHAEAMRAMHSADVVILPFVVTELVQAVDPVKVYEYVSAGRPAVCVDYAQLEHFGDAVLRYETPEEFVSCVSESLGRESTSVDMRKSFVARNSWSERAQRILREL